MPHIHSNVKLELCFCWHEPQQRCAMHLCEFNVEMKHRSGRMLHVPGMLTRLGCTTDHGKEPAQLMHVTILDTAASGCKDSQLFVRDVQQERPRARMDATGMPGEVVALCARLTSSDTGLGTVQGSWRAERASRAVEICNLVFGSLHGLAHN